MITVHESNALDFGSLGLGALTPTEGVVEEQAGGMYELTITQPITDDLRHTLLVPHRIIKAPAPVRETPLIEIGQAGTVTREIYRIATPDGRSRLYLRAGAGQNSKGIHAYAYGLEVVVLEKPGTWWRVAIPNGGATGWMYGPYLRFVRNETETIIGDTPGTVIQPRQTRDQLFRIYEVSTDTEKRTVTAKAQHITYDLKGAIISEEYAPEDVPADQVCAQLLARIDHDPGFVIYCTCTDPITADFTGKNLLECLLDPESGVLAQTGGRLVRDNFDLFILADEERDRGARLTYKKNLLCAIQDTDTSNIITRIQPVGKNKDGEDLVGAMVDSEHINDYPVIYTKRIQYDVVVDKTKTEAQALEELAEKAAEEFASGCDLPTVHMDTDFVRLELTQDYAALASAYALHLYDIVPVTDDQAGVYARVRMTGYKYDVLLDRYASTKLGDLTDYEPSVYGYDIASGSITGSRIAGNSVPGDKLRSESIAYAKLKAAAIEHLSADAINAQTAYIESLTAQTINTDTLAAAYAHLFELVADAITAGTITADTLTASMARLTQASIGHADIDWAQIRTATIEQLITRDAVADRYFIDKLQVRNLQVVEQTVGSLIVKASNGSYYRLDVDAANGSVTPVMVTPSAGEIAAGVTSDGNRSIIETDLTVADLSASNIKAINALIDKITADRIDVDKLFARQAVIGALQTADISGNESLQFAVTGGLNTGDDAGVKVLITKDRFSINVQGGEEEVVLNESGAVMRNVTVTEELNAPKLLKIFPGGDYSIGLPPAGDTRSYVHVYSTVADFVRDVAYKTLDGFTTVYLNKDISEGMTLIGLSGIRLCINGNAHDWFGTMRFSSCSCGEIVVQDTKIHATTNGATLVYVDGCHYVNLNNVSFYGHLKAGTMVQYLQGSHGMVVNCGFYDDAGNNCTGVFAAYATNVYIQNQKGGVNNPFIGAGCSACWVGTRALGTIAYAAPCLLNPTDLSSLPTDPGEGGGGGDTEPVTVTFPAQYTRNCRATGSWDSVSAAQTTIQQNFYNNVYQKGCIWFNIPDGTFAGKTIQSIALRLHRPSAGYGTTAAVKVQLALLTFTYDDNRSQARTLPNTLTGTSYYSDATYTTFLEVGSIQRNEQLDFDLPLTEGMKQHIIANHGICLFGGETRAASGHNYSTNYAQFSGAAATGGLAPQLLITYK